MAEHTNEPRAAAYRNSCPTCEANIPDGVDLPYSCPECGYTFCPYCWTPSDGSEVVDYCRHVLAAGSTATDDWYKSPFSEDDLPHLDALPSEGYWSAEQKAKCFGDLTPLLESYEEFDGLAALPRKHEIVDELVRIYSLPVVSSFRMDAVMGNIEADFEYFTADVAAVRGVLDDALGKLSVGFERLSRLPPSPNVRPPDIVPRY